MKREMNMKKFSFLICFAMMISLVCNVNASEFYSRKTLWSLEFEDDMGGAEKYTFAEFSLALKDGTLAGRYQESKPYMELNPFAAPIPASDIECIDIKISSKNDMTLKFYFKTNKEDNWSEERNFQIKPSGGSEMNIYSIDTSGIKNWDNSITRLRMDFLGSDGGYATNELNIDYIRALGGEGSSSKPTAGGILYDFEKNSKTDGWKFDAGESEADISDGKISVESDGAKALETCGLADVSAKDFGNISISMQNGTAADKARLYFKNKVGGEYEDYFEFNIVPNDRKVRTYRIITGKNKNWDGDINGLKFDFGNAPGAVTIDEIYLRKYPFEISIDDNNITVTGKAAANLPVSFQLADADADLNSAASGNYSDAVIYTDETETAADGSFKIVCRTPQSAEPQRFAVTASVGDTAYMCRKSYVHSGYADVILGQYNDAVANADAALAERLTDENYEYLGLNSVGYAEYRSAYKNPGLFGEYLVYLGAAESISDLERKISEASVFVSVMTAEKETAVSLAEKYDSLMKLSQDRAYYIYNMFEAAEKSEILNAARGDAKSLDDIRKVFTEKTILYGISITLGADAVKKILHENKDIIGIDVSGETSLKDPGRLYAAVGGKLYGSYAQLAEAYNSALKTCRENERASSGGGSSGGGGGKGSSSGKSTTSVMPTVPVIRTEAFSDLEGFEWAKESIEKLYEKGIVSGKTEESFMPGDNISRAEFIKMITAAMSMNEIAAAPFKDIENGAWYREYVDKAYAAGIVLGNPNGEFYPNDNISRQDMAVIIYRAAEKYFSDIAENGFADKSDIAPYAADAVNALSGAGIINGMPDGTFAPAEFATRAQTAVIIERLLKYIGRI